MRKQEGGWMVCCVDRQQEIEATIQIMKEWVEIEMKEGLLKLSLMCTWRQVWKGKMEHGKKRE